MIKFTVAADLKQLPNVLILPFTAQQVSQDDFEQTANLLRLPLELLKKDFKGEKGEVAAYHAGATRFFLIGMGNQPSTGEIIQLFRSFSYRQHAKFTAPVGITLLHQEQSITVIEAIFNGLLLGTYQIGHLKTEVATPHFLKQEGEIEILIYTTTSETMVLEAAQRGIATAETQMEMFELVNLPSNYKTPQTLADWAVQSAKTHGYQATVLDKAAIEALGMRTLLAVNRGSEHPATFTIVEYKNEAAQQKIGLVGKGVTFDTGGISMKESSNMHYMKSDMGGAAAVLGAVELAAKLKLPVHVIGVIPSTDNSVDALSIKPGDVIESYSGKTIEIIDTDAEGRLILADAITYILKHHQPNVLIDLATLTGSAIRTFGYHSAALFSNNSELVEGLMDAATKTGERVWQLPLWDVYKDEIKSDVADVRNFSGKPTAGAISAAKFLEVFIEQHPAWAHLDIAGVAFTDSEFASQKSASAYGVRLLIALMEYYNARLQK